MAEMDWRINICIYIYIFEIEGLKSKLIFLPLLLLVCNHEKKKNWKIDVRDDGTDERE